MTDLDRIQVIGAAELIGEERRRHEGFMERARGRHVVIRNVHSVRSIVERATGLAER